MNSKQEIRLKGVLSAAHHDFAKALNTHASFKLPDQTLSNDLVQDTFMKTWRYLTARWQD